MSRSNPPDHRGPGAVAGLRQRQQQDDGPPQLQIGGGEVSSQKARATSSAGRTPGLNTTQRLIMAKIGRDGSIRSVEAGVIIHEQRGSYCCRAGAAGADRFKGGGLSCCAYASSDGAEAMKRLAKRGLVRRASAGVWEKA